MQGEDRKDGEAMDPEAVTEKLQADPEFQRALEQAKAGEDAELEAALQSEASFIAWLSMRFPWMQPFINDIIPIAPALMTQIAALFR